MASSRQLKVQAVEGSGSSALADVTVDCDVKPSDGNESKVNINDLKGVYESKESEVNTLESNDDIVSSADNGARHQDSASGQFHGFDIGFQSKNGKEHDIMTF